MSDEHPVFVAVSVGGRTEQVRVGTAVRSGDGFVLRLGELRIGGAPIQAAQGAQGGYGAPAPASSWGEPPRQSAPPPVGGSGGGMVFPNYGRSKGQPIAGASIGDLEYYGNGCRRTLGDPAKARFHDREKVMLAAIEAELVRQRGMPPMDSGEGEYGGPPPGSDEDIPF